MPASVATLDELVHRANAGAVFVDFVPVEVRFRRPGENWRRKVVRSERRLERAIDNLVEEGAEIVTRDMPQL